MVIVSEPHPVMDYKNGTDVDNGHICTKIQDNLNITLRGKPLRFMRFSDEMTVHVSPAEPRYFSFKFLNDGRDTVLLRVDSPDDLCMTVSIQNISCPVFDLEKNVLFEGYWQSMSRRGGITLTPQLGVLGYRPVCKNDVGVGEKAESATP
uniref:Uncharacterized protein n=1 Tax=Timema poppense TaxID=170557 RepID=A0A7R9H9A1_TIMPO|nr:unnamed protein product [Timema poppensis]